jgi:hypothetical protein
MVRVSALRVNAAIRPSMPQATVANCLSTHACRHPIQPAGGIKIVYCLGAPDVAGHPAQDLPQIVVHHLVVERFQHRDEGMDLNARWEGLAAAADEDARVFCAGRCSEIPRLAQADLIEIEDFGEEGAELGIAPDPVLGENKGAALASSDGVVITLTTVIQSSVRLRIRKSAISAAISGPESSWRKCRPVTRCGPSACDRAA